MKSSDFIFSIEVKNALHRFLELNNQVNFVMQFSPKYGSENPDHRNLIRTDLLHQFGESWSEQQKQIFLDLSEIPTLPNGHVSISHTQNYGVWVYGATVVGVDLEQTNKIQDKIVARISGQSELDHTHSVATSFAPLWTAKESSFKALNRITDIKLLSQIEINWQKKELSSQNETILLFQAKTTKKNCCNGFTVLSNDFSFSVALV